MEPEERSNDGREWWLLLPVAIGLVLIVLFAVILLKSRQTSPITRTDGAGTSRGNSSASAPDSVGTSASAVSELSDTEQSEPPIRTAQKSTCSRTEKTSRTTVSKAASSRRSTRVSSSTAPAASVDSSGQTTASTAATFDMTAAYLLELEQLESTYTDREAAIKEAYYALQVERDVELEILREKYAALGQPDSGAYLAEKDALLARYQQMLEDNRQELEQLRLDKEVELMQLKKKYKIPE